MEMKLKGREFWVLEDMSNEGDVGLYDDLQDAVEALKELMISGAKSSDLSLVSVDMRGKDWRIEEVAWSEIAERLVTLNHGIEIEELLK